MDNISPGGAIYTGEVKGFEFRRITLNVYGCMAGCTEYEVLNKGDKVEISLYEGGWQYDENVSRESCLKSRKYGGRTLYEEMTEFFGVLDIEKWRGFSKSNPYVLDGGGFSFEAELPDGSTLFAHGSNSYPENYGKFENYLREKLA